MKLTDLPPVPASVKADYHLLIEEVEHLAAPIAERLHEHLRCAPGCASCCRPFSLSPLEAALIAEHLKSEPDTACASPGPGNCRFLARDLCTAYQNRPLICRTQGLPIGYIDEMNEQIEVSACPLNFPDDHPFTLEDLLLLDPVNARLGELNRRYCEKTGIDAKFRFPLDWPEPLRRTGQ